MTDTGPIRDILSQKPSHVWSIGPTATVFEAIQMMADKNIGALLVLDGERLVGILSERDYTRKVILKGKQSRQTPVQEIMTAPVVTASSRQPVEECMRIMASHHIRHLPVVDDGKLVGILSVGDLLKWIISAQNITINQLENYISGKYPG